MNPKAHIVFMGEISECPVLVLEAIGKQSGDRLVTGDDYERFRIACAAHDHMRACIFRAEISSILGGQYAD